jgi:hypothetical protein
MRCQINFVFCQYSYKRHMRIRAMDAYNASIRPGNTVREYIRPIRLILLYNVTVFSANFRRSPTTKWPEICEEGFFVALTTSQNYCMSTRGHRPISHLTIVEGHR